MRPAEFRALLRRAFKGLAEAAAHAGRQPSPATIALASEQGFTWTGREFIEGSHDSDRHECEVRQATGQHRADCPWCARQRSYLPDGSVIS